MPNNCCDDVLELLDFALHHLLSRIRGMSDEEWESQHK
jgi:hypothetical protein